MFLVKPLFYFQEVQILNPAYGLRTDQDDTDGVLPQSQNSQ